MYKIDAAFNEVTERFSFQHAVLEQGKVDKLVDLAVLLAIAGQDFVLLFFLNFDVGVALAHIVFFFLSDLFRLFVVLRSEEHTSELQSPD